MRSLSRVFILCIFTRLVDNNAGELLSNQVDIDDQANSPNPFMGTENPTELTASPNFLKPLLDTNEQVESAAPLNVALISTVPQGPAIIGDPTVDDTKTGDDHSSNPPPSRNSIPSKNLAFDWRDPPIDCLPNQIIACCILDLMWICERLIQRLSDFCKKSRLMCCDNINADNQCVVNGEVVLGNENDDSVEHVGTGVRGGSDMTDQERETYEQDRSAAEQRRRESEQRVREAEQRLREAEQKAKNDEIEFYQQEGDKIRNDAKNGAIEDSDFHLPTFGIPELLQPWLQQNAN